MSKTNFIFLLILTSKINSAGVRVQIKQSVIDSLKNAALPKLISSLVGTKIDDFRFDKFGAECHSSNFRIENFEIREKFDITLENDQLCIKSNRIYMTLFLHLDCKAAFIRSSGDAKIHLSTNEFGICLKLKVTPDKKFDFDVTWKAVHINEVDIEATRGDFFFKKVIPVILDLFNSQIRDKVNEIIREQFDRFVVVTLKDLIRKTPTELEVDSANHILVDYAPAEAPMLRKGVSYLASSYFYRRDDIQNKVPPFEEPKNIQEIESDFGIVFSFSEFMFNDLLWCYFINTDHYHFEIDSKNEFIPINFTVKDFSNLLFGGLDKIFDPASPVKIVLEGMDRPIVSIKKNSLEGGLTLKADFVVLEKEKQSIFIDFVIHVDIGFIAELIQTKTLKIKLTKATIGTFEHTKFFDFKFNEMEVLFLLKGLLMVFVKKFVFSYDIPISGFPEEVVLKESTLVYNEAVLSLMANIDFKPFHEVSPEI